MLAEALKKPKIKNKYRKLEEKFGLNEEELNNLKHF